MNCMNAIDKCLLLFGINQRNKKLMSNSNDITVLKEKNKNCQKR